MSSLFVDTNNVVAILKKSDAAEGFAQIINFLSGSYIHYALTVNPHIYISCIKQFWNTASVKRSGMVCLPNEEIFAGLAQMGYEKPSTKLTFYKAFFSSQWKFLIHTILQSLSAKRTSWNEFSTAMASAVICISKGQKFNFSKYIFDSLVRNVDSNSKFYMYPRFIQLIIQNQVGDLSTRTTCFISPALTQKVFANMRRVGKGFLGVETPLFEGMLENVAEDVSHAAIPSPPPYVIPSPSQEPSKPPHQQQSSPQGPPQDAEFPTQLQQVLNVCSALFKRVENLENDNAAQKLVRASRRVKSSNDMKDIFNQGRMIADIDMNKGIELVKDAEVAESEGRHAEKQAEIKQVKIYNLDLDHSSKVLSMQEDDSEVQEVVEVVTTAKLITEVVTAAASQEVSAASTTIPAASATIPAAKPTIAAAILTIGAAYTRRWKGIIIRDPEEELSLKTPAETPKEEINKDYEKFDENIRFLFKSREEMEAEDQEIIQSINETPAQRVAKRRKLSEEAQEAKDLRKRLEVVEDKNDDVFVEATPLVSKVLVVDYQIVLIDNKPRFRIIKADKTHQFYSSFATLLKNFDREDLENLWRIVKDRFSTSKPTNFSDEYLLLTLRTMFKEPDGQDAIWRNQKCSWFGIGEKMEAADFMLCSCHYSFNSSALSIG
nr:hypothetical protein [Tanacetum cinerariifolium]